MVRSWLDRSLSYIATWERKKIQICLDSHETVGPDYDYQTPQLTIGDRGPTSHFPYDNHETAHRTTGSSKESFVKY